MLGVCIGLLAAWGFRREDSGQKPDSTGTNDYTSEADANTAEADSQDAAGTDQLVNYPFSDDQEGWQLILHEEIVENRSDRLHPFL